MIVTQVTRSLTARDYATARKYYATLRKYWLSLYAQNNKVPFRKQFSPLGVRALIPHLYMVERTDEGGMVMRHRGTGLEDATQRRFLPGDHLSSFTDVDWAQMARYFNTIFAGPCAMEADWRYFTKGGEVYDAVCYSVPLFGKDENERIAIGLMLLRQILIRIKLRNVMVEMHLKCCTRFIRILALVFPTECQ